MSGDCEVSELVWVRMFGSAFVNMSRSEAVEFVLGLAKSKRNRAWLVCVKDVALTVRCMEDKGLRDFYASADAVFVDGKGIVYASRLLAKPLKEMVGGPGLYTALLGRVHVDGLNVYFLGASQQVLDHALYNVARRHPEIRVVGRHHGFFSADERPKVIRDIEASGADIVFVGMATPMREQFMASARERLSSCVMVAVGGMFDVEAGRAKLAPPLIGKIGLEWLYRCMQEPKRLGPRYLRTHPKFVALLCVEIGKRFVSSLSLGRMRTKK